MQRKFALLILGALVALVIPASASAAIFPAEHKFEIAPSTGSAPLIGTSLGTCQLTKISGEIPKAPANESAFLVPAPTFGSCTTGTTISVAGAWHATAGSYQFNLLGSGFETSTDAIAMRFSSLPGCKLASTATVISGVWSNGLTGPTLKSGYHGHSARGFTWANDGGSCALNGQKELVSFKSPSSEIALVNSVTDLTNASTPIIIR